MKKLLTTTAICAAMSGFAFAAQAQESNGNAEETASAGSTVAVSCEKPWGTVDVNDDGFVSESEADKHTDNRFSMIDADGNGEISQSEYRDCFTRGPESASAETDRSEQNFSKADTNADDAISAEEYRELAELSYQNVKEAQVTDVGAEPFVVLRRYVWLSPEEAQDADKMNAMSADEAAARSAMSFNALDKNNDDMVGIEEWKNRAPASGMNEERANTRFGEIDRDTSGSLSNDEFNQAQSDRLDRTETSSTNADEAASAEQDAANNTEDRGIPVYIYRFQTM